MNIKIISERMQKNCSINWEDVNRINFDDKVIDDFIIYSSEINNPYDDVNRVKKIKDLTINGSIALVSSDIKVLDYLAFALKDVKSDRKKIFYEGKQDESLEEHFLNCKKLGYGVTTSPETVMWLPNSALEMIDNISLGYELNMDGGIAGTNKLLNDVKDRNVREQLDSIISNLLDEAEKNGAELSTLDKIVYVSNYIQANYQYCQGILSDVKGTSYEVTQNSLEEMGLRPIDSRR